MIARIFFALLFILTGPQAWAQTAEAARGPWNVYLGTSKLAPDHATEAACVEAARLLPSPPASAVQAYGCRTITRVTVTQPPAAPPAPVETWTRIAGEGEAFTVPAGSTVRYGAGGTFFTRVVSGAGQCTNTFFGGDPAREVVKACDVSNAAPVPTPDPTPDPVPDPTPTPVPGAAVTYYFSDCVAGAASGCVPGSNANPGTQASPKQSLAGVVVNTLPAGSQLLFARGGAWNWAATLRLDNRNTSAAAPLTFGAYGTGPEPLILMTPTYGIETGEWQNTIPDGGYVFRGLKFQRPDNGAPDAVALWLRGTVSDVLVEDVEFEGFFIAMRGQGGNAVERVTVRNSRFIRNRSMGVNGTFNNSLFENNLFEGNNITGSGFEHGIYLSNFTNFTLRNNRFVRNSVINGVCQGGNVTFHGMNDGLVIEGNTIEQDAAAPGCWLLSITQGYATAEGFRNTVVRNNRLINGGNNAMNAQSAPGILIEGNVIINTQPASQIAISVGHTDYPNGDLPDGNATVRNNTVCQSGGASGAAVVFRNNPGAVESGNVVITGAAATTGVCAR